MSKISELVQRNVEFVPEKLEQGILYVSEKFKLAIHSCACGCGHETVTPLQENWWELSDGPTLKPSIGNMQICGAHYFVTNGKIIWV